MATTVVFRCQASRSNAEWGVINVVMGHGECRIAHWIDSWPLKHVNSEILGNMETGVSRFVLIKKLNLGSSHSNSWAGAAGAGE